MGVLMKEQKQRVFINGGSRGIGAAMVRLFAENGYHVVFSYFRAEEEARALAEQYGALAICADSGNRDAVQAAVEKVYAECGDIDVLINNAALSFSKLYTDVTEKEWERMLDVNLQGPMRYIKCVLPRMISRKYGKIINISSMWGQIGASCEVHYSVTKSALIGLTKALAKEVGPSGITVNAIAPGVIQTQMNECYDEETMAALAEETPLMRLGTPNDVAQAALFLASEGASFITGQVIAPNGGYVI